MSDKDIILKYLYYKEAKLNREASEASERNFRFSLDSVQLLEEIIAKERLQLLHEIEQDIINLLNVK